jgi:hypothetical protein
MRRIGWNRSASLALIVFFQTAAPALASRLALVVGNSAYQNVSPLDNPTNDAKLYADTLRDLIAAFTLMPPGSDILTVEFKTNLLARARGERFASDASRCPLRSKAR